MRKSFFNLFASLLLLSIGAVSAQSQTIDLGLFKKAANLNNHGVSLMATGDMNNAMVTFKRALKGVAAKADYGAPSPFAGAVPVTLDSYMRMMMMQSSSSKSQHEKNHDDDDHDDDADYDLFPYVYEQPIVVPTNDKILMSHTDSATKAILSIILMFNLALAHHLLALQLLFQDSDDIVRSKALAGRASTLYQLAYELYESNNKGIDTGSFLFSLILINNQAALVHQVANDDPAEALASNQCFQYLKSRMLILTDKRDYERLAFCKGLIRNTAHLISL